MKHREIFWPKASSPSFRGEGWLVKNQNLGVDRSEVSGFKSNQMIFILKFQNTYLVIYVQVNIKEMRKGQPNNNTVILGRCPFTS